MTSPKYTGTTEWMGRVMTTENCIGMWQAGINPFTGQRATDEDKIAHGWPVENA